jgi:hypothetical protein
MAPANSLTIVVPTRDDADSSTELLHALMAENRHQAVAVRVLFLANDTVEYHTASLATTVADPYFSTLSPRLFRARKNFPTCEENIVDTLGGNLDAVDSHFLIIGNSDRVVLSGLAAAVRLMREHAMDLLLVGVMNREVYQGRLIRQQYVTPRHLDWKNRLSAADSMGDSIFSEAISDYGPEALGYLGCQIYTKQFFAELCPIMTGMPEPLWSIAFGTLELTTQKQWKIGFTPEIVTIRVDRLQYGANSGAYPPDWWVIRSRIDRGFSRHLTLAMITNSLQLSSRPFETLANAQVVSTARGSSQYSFSNFLFMFVEQLRDATRECFHDHGYRYSWGELQDIVRFAKRLSTVEIGLPEEAHWGVCAWLESFGMIGDYSNGSFVHELVASADAVLTLLDRRPAMERWIASLQSSPLVLTS